MGFVSEQLSATIAIQFDGLEYLLDVFGEKKTKRHIINYQLKYTFELQLKLTPKISQLNQILVIYCIINSFKVRKLSSWCLTNYYKTVQISLLGQLGPFRRLLKEFFGIGALVQSVQYQVNDGVNPLFMSFQKFIQNPSKFGVPSEIVPQIPSEMLVSARILKMEIFEKTLPLFRNSFRYCFKNSSRKSSRNYPKSCL